MLRSLQLYFYLLPIVFQLAPFYSFNKSYTYIYMCVCKYFNLKCFLNFLHNLFDDSYSEEFLRWTQKNAKKISKSRCEYELLDVTPSEVQCYVYICIYVGMSKQSRKYLFAQPASVSLSIFNIHTKRGNHSQSFNTFEKISELFVCFKKRLHSVFVFVHKFRASTNTEVKS